MKLKAFIAVIEWKSIFLSGKSVAGVQVCDSNAWLTALAFTSK
jgi:hypothetical protein